MLGEAESIGWMAVDSWEWKSKRGRTSFGRSEVEEAKEVEEEVLMSLDGDDFSRLLAELLEEWKYVEVVIWIRHSSFLLADY